MTQTTSFPRAAGRGGRLVRRADGFRSLLSYLLFTALWRQAPGMARRASRLAERRHRYGWMAGHGQPDQAAFDICYRGRRDTAARWLLDRLGADRIELSAAHSASACDVELLTIPADVAHDYARVGHLILPRWLHHRQPLERPPSDFERRVAAAIDAGRVRVRFSRDARDFEHFYATLYEPMLQRRHGERALRTGRALLRWGQHRGGLFLSEIDGRAVAGAVGAPSGVHPGEVEIWALGAEPSARGAVHYAPVCAWIRWAREHGYRHVNHLLTLPLLSDGLTRSKLRWGGDLVEPEERLTRLALRLHRGRAAHDAWLGRHTFVAWTPAGLVSVGSERSPKAGLVAAHTLSGHREFVALARRLAGAAT